MKIKNPFPKISLQPKVTSLIVTVVLLTSFSLAFLLLSKDSKLNLPILKGGSVLQQSTSKDTLPTTQEVLSSPLPSESPAGEAGWRGVISVDGTETYIYVSVPSKGGKITGSASGYCTGNIEGAFDSTTSFTHGTLSGTCASLPASGTFKGNIYLDKGMGNGTFEGQATVFSKSGSWTISPPQTNN
jgi:hypothetical protein